MLEISRYSLIHYRSDVSTSCVVAAVLGFLSHIAYFMHGFRVMQVKRIIIFYLLGLGLLLARNMIMLGFRKGMTTYFAISSSYFATLFFSIGTYRLFFHPLRQFPGPIAAKITKFYTPWLGRHGKLHSEYVDLHLKYGDFVRIGPNEISIVNADAYDKIHGPQTKCSKKDTGSFDSLHYKGEYRLVSITDHSQHRKRRKIWNQALSRKGNAITLLWLNAHPILEPNFELTSPAVEKYELSTRLVMRDWLSRLEKLKGSPIDTSFYSKLLAFDNMGHIGYSVDFGSVRDGREDRMVHLLDITFRNFARIGQMTWPQALIMDLPKFGMQKEYENLGVRLVDQRIKNDSDDKHDMMKYFLADMKLEQPKALTNLNVLYADGQSILSGATHTTTCVISLIFYYLARDPHLRQRVYDEIAPLHSRTETGEFTASDLNTAVLLNSVITEAMRVNAPVPLSSPRTVPPEGIEIAGIRLPGGIHVFTPTHVYNLSEKYYVRSRDFIPERWTTRPELVLDKRVFHPFGFGHYDCVGQKLVKDFLQLVIAYTLWDYDFAFAPCEDGTKFHGDERFQITLKPGSLNCVFTNRRAGFSVSALGLDTHLHTKDTSATT